MSFSPSYQLMNVSCSSWWQTPAPQGVVSSPEVKIISGVKWYSQRQTLPQNSYDLCGEGGGGGRWRGERGRGKHVCMGVCACARMCGCSFAFVCSCRKSNDKWTFDFYRTVTTLIVTLHKCMHHTHKTQTTIHLFILLTSWCPKSVPVRTEQKMTGFCSENEKLRRKFLGIDRRWKASPQIHQNLLKKNTESRPCLPSQTFTACVVWCGAGH